MHKNQYNINDLKEKINDVAIPNNIDHYIYAGINKGKVEKAKKKKRFFSSVAISLILFFMILSIRISPEVAAAVSKVPGLDKIVNLINYDRGLQLAIENDFMQHIGASDNQNDIKITVDDIIIDESRMVIFYSLENNSQYKQVNLYRAKLLDSNDNALPVGISYNYFDEKEGKGENLKGKLDITFMEGQEIPNKIILETKIRVGLSTDQILPSNWRISIPVNKKDFEGLKDVYTLDKTVEIEGQKITFNNVTVYPTKIAIDVKYDENNSKKIFSLEDLRIVDENGEELYRPNGVIASQLDENTERLYLQSNYFKRPKELYIKVGSILALDKDKLDVVVDLKQQEIIKRPDERLELKEIRAYDDEIELMFLLTPNTTSKQELSEFSFIFSGMIKDAKGNIYHSTQLASSEQVEGDVFQYIRIKKLDYSNPISLELNRYPSEITGEINVKVK